MFTIRRNKLQCQNQVIFYYVIPQALDTESLFQMGLHLYLLIWVDSTASFLIGISDNNYFHMYKNKLKLWNYKKVFFTKEMIELKPTQTRLKILDSLKVILKDQKMNPVESQNTIGRLCALSQ